MPVVKEQTSFRKSQSSRQLDHRHCDQYCILVKLFVSCETSVIRPLNPGYVASDFAKSCCPTVAMPAWHSHEASELCRKDLTYGPWIPPSSRSARLGVATIVVPLSLKCCVTQILWPSKSYRTKLYESPRDLFRHPQQPTQVDHLDLRSVCPAVSSHVLRRALAIALSYQSYLIGSFPKTS